MNPAEQNLLLERYCATRDIAIRNSLAGEFLYIAELVARRYAGRGVEYDDLFQVASIALIKALDRFDCTAGVRFPSYATPSVIGEVKNHFRDKLRLMRVPRRSSEILRQIENARDVLWQELGRNPSADELAQRLNLDVSDVLEALEMGAAVNIASLDLALSEDDDEGALARLGRDDPELDRIADNDFLQSVMNTLSPFERIILSQRYQEHRSQRDIAREHHVSQMFISNLERKLLERFRQYSPYNDQKI